MSRLRPIAMKFMPMETTMSSVMNSAAPRCSSPPSLASGVGSAQTSTIAVMSANSARKTLA
jgi:hypothetical protein